MKRIQRRQRVVIRRTKGWKAPDSFRSCARPQEAENQPEFGNPIRVGEFVPNEVASNIVNIVYGSDPHADDIDLIFADADYEHYVECGQLVEDAAEAVRLFKRYVLPEWIESGKLEELRRFEHLGCFCKDDQPCHVDPMIEYLNGDVK